MFKCTVCKDQKRGMLFLSGSHQARQKYRNKATTSLEAHFAYELHLEEAVK